MNSMEPASFSLPITATIHVHIALNLIGKLKCQPVCSTGPTEIEACSKGAHLVMQLLFKVHRGKGGGGGKLAHMM